MTDWNLIRDGDIADAIDHLADMLLPPARPAPKPTTCVHVEVGLRDLANRLRAAASQPVRGDHDHRSAQGWIRPTEKRIDNGVESIIQAVQAVRSMDQMMREEVKEWQPSKFTRKQWRFFAEDILRADARWRWEHPEEPV